MLNSGLRLAAAALLLGMFALPVIAEDTAEREAEFIAVLESAPPTTEDAQARAEAEAESARERIDELRSALDDIEAQSAGAEEELEQARSVLDEAKANLEASPELDAHLDVLTNEWLHDNWLACRELSQMGSEAAVASLAPLLSDEDRSHMARYALEPMPYEAASEALRNALDEVDGRLLAGVIHSLGVRRDADAAGAVAERLTHSDNDVASAAARALGEIATDGAVDALSAFYEEAGEEVKPAVHDGLLRAAERLFARGNRLEASSIYQRVGEPRAVADGEPPMIQ